MVKLELVYTLEAKQQPRLRILQSGLVTHRHVATAQCSRPGHGYESYHFNDGGSYRVRKDRQERLNTHDHLKDYGYGSYHFHRDHRERRDTYDHAS